MKKIVVILLSMLLTSAFVGCGQSKTTSSSSLASVSMPSSSPASSQAPSSSIEASIPQMDQPAVVTTIENEDVMVIVETPKLEYTVEDVINLKVTLVNITDNQIVFVRGSGSAVVPDALKVDLGGFNPLYVPNVMTNDLRVETLEAGQSITYELPIAPYTPNDGQFVFGTDNNIEFFKTDKFTAATVGEAKGTIKFSYSTVKDGESKDIITQNADKFIEGKFGTKIV